jgi:hypothetical protein
MLKKVKVLGTEASFYDRGQLNHRVNVKNVEEVYFNTSLIKRINILTLNKKTVWKIQLVDEEILFTLPFKL